MPAFLRSCLLPCLAFFAISLQYHLQASTPQFPDPPLTISGQTITYHPYANGDRIPDFSTVGFNYGNTPLPGEPGGPEVPVLVTLAPGTGDQTDRIQAAIDWLATRPLVNGFRGSVLLKAGRWEIHSVNRIRVTSSGIVIRGESDHPITGTRLYAIGTTNENQSGNTRNSRIIAFDGGGLTVGTTRTLVDNVYIPGGTNFIPITGHPFTVGQRIQVRWPGSVAWQKASFYNTAATSARDPAITFNRVITAVTANSITLDAPITSPLDPAWGRGYVVPVTAFNYITNVGISDIYFESTYADDEDENHVWNALDFTEVEDGFVHQCTARHFAYSIAYVNTSTRKITINRSQVHDSISVIQGGRRYSFVLTGEMGLVSNSIGRNGRHTFIINWPAAPGPNVFVDGTSERSFSESGSHADWNNGGLWDNIAEMSATTGLQVKLERPSAFCVAWNVVTNRITFENMPLSPNWSFGTTSVNGGTPTWVSSLSTGPFAYAANHVGKAEVWSNGTRMTVRSLYENQLHARLRAVENLRTYTRNQPTRVPLPPTIRTPAQLIVQADTPFSYQVSASNLVPYNRSPNFTTTGLPAGLSISTSTGLITGTTPTVVSETNYNVTLTARNQDGTTTRPLTLTVRPAGAPKIPLSMSLEVDMNRTTSILIAGVRSQITTPIPVPMVPASRLLAPMIVRKAYTSDINNTTYTLADIPVPVRGVLPIEGLTSPVIITYNGSTTLPTLPGYYDLVATLDDPIYQATATGRLLITNATAATVTLGNTASPTAASPVTATYSVTGVTPQPVLTPVITYDGSPTFPETPGHYAAKAIVADPEYFGSRLSLIGIPPGITQQPTALTVSPGEPATFSVVATGEPLTYQWRKNGQDIAGATSASYTLTSAQLADAGSYQVLVTHPAGSTLTAAATLTILQPPQITVQPLSLNVAQGGSAALSVVATGGSLSYQWRKGGQPIAGATSATLALSSIQTADAGSYDVVVSNPLGTLPSTSATLTVVTAPQVTRDPVSLTITQGEPAAFTLAASGIGNTYQWRKDGQPIAGATDTRFTVFPVRASDAGTYDVLVTNLAGSVPTASFTLAVVTPPAITQQPLSQTAIQGTTVTFSTAASGLGNTYQWMKDGTVIPGARSTSYTLAAAQPNDAGTYDALVTNSAGLALTNPATLTVLSPPQITRQPAAITVGQGLPATFRVTATGGSLSYQWRRAGVDIAGATDASFTIPATQSGDAASYDVVVSNSAGNVSSAPATLAVVSSGVLQKANNTTALDQAASWSPATLPTANDTALWTSTYTNGSVSVGSGLSIGRVQLTSPSTAITLNAGTGPLTLGGGGFDLSTATQNLTVNAPVTLVAHQTWTVNTGRTLTVNSSIADNGAGLGINLNGAGTTVLAANNTYTGPTSLSAGALHLGPTTGGITGSLTGPLIMSGGTLNYNRTDAQAPIGGVFSSSAGTIQVTRATGTFTLNTSNLPVGSVNSFSTLGGVAGASMIINGSPGSTLSFGGGVAGMNLTVMNGTVNFTTNGGAFNFRIDGGTFISTPTDRFQLASANQTFTVNGGTVDLRASAQFGFRVGGSGSSSQAGAQQVLATQSGGVVLASALSIGGTDTVSTRSPSHTLSGGTLALNTNLSIGADSAGLGSTTFNLSGGLLRVPGTLAGSQPSARQVFSMTGGTLAVGTATFTNLRSTDTAANGTFTQTAGTLAPGDVGTPGRTTINGGYTLGAGATLALDLGGTSAATAFQGTSTQFDNLVVNGTTALGGNLSISLINGYLPPANATFTVLTSTLSGAFANAPSGSRLITTGAEGSFLVTQTGTTVTLSDFTRLAPVAAWRQLSFGTTVNTGLAADGADADRDGVPNLVELALGSDPSAPSSVAPPAVSAVAAGANRNLQLSFHRARSDLTYVIESSPDLLNWTAIASDPGAVGQFITVTDPVNLSAAGAPRRFLRLRVVAP